MSKGGYEKLLKKLQESATENLRLHAEIAGRDQRINELRSVALDSRNLQGASVPTKEETRFGRLWNSTPLWAVVSMLFTLIVSSWSIKILYVLAWGALCVEFFRIPTFADPRVRHTSDVLFAVVLAVAIVVEWPYLPKPREDPNWDRSFAALGDRLSRVLSERVAIAPSSGTATSQVATVRERAGVELDRIDSAYRSDQNPMVHPWLIPDHDIEVNLYFLNNGPAQAQHFRGYGRVYLVSSDPNTPDESKSLEKRRNEKILLESFKKSWAKTLADGGLGGPMAPTGREFEWFTAHSERVITQDDISKLQNGGELAFLFYAAQYTDPAGQHFIHRCQLAQPPAFVNPEAWQICNVFLDRQ